AYGLYLQGVDISRHASTKEDHEKAIDYLRRALKADPTYAQAWAALSAVLADTANAGFAPMEQTHQESRRAAERALELGPNLADAHVATARYFLLDELDVVDGNREVQRALELAPNDQWA